MRTVYGPIYTLRPFERGIQEKLGKYQRVGPKWRQVSLHVRA
jgi:hypothetical protein